MSEYTLGLEKTKTEPGYNTEVQASREHRSTVSIISNVQVENQQRLLFRLRLLQ